MKKTRNGEYVEFGTGNGDETNTRLFREQYGWWGLLMDGYAANNDNPKINLHNEKISHQNILDLFAKYKVSQDLDLLSVDTDYADYWILEKILGQYTPKLVVVETNLYYSDCVTVTKPEKIIMWNGGDIYHGTSLCAFQCLASRFGYTVVYCEKKNVNCFLVRDDVLESMHGVKAEVFRKVLTSSFLRPNLKRKLDLPAGKQWYEVEC